MSRTRFWTIFLGTDPTAFRARDKDALLPTLRQLQRRNPDAVIKWFERGKIFDSPEAAAAEAQRAREPRPRDWRPGGEHRDPRARYKLPRDEKRRRFKLRARRAQAMPEPPDTGAARPARSGTSRPSQREAGPERRPGRGGSRPARPPGRPDRPKKPRQE
jgi:hypothetical protein